MSQTVTQRTTKWTLLKGKLKNKVEKGTSKESKSTTEKGEKGLDLGPIFGL